MPAPGQELEPSIGEFLDAPRPESNRRVHGRVALKLPICVRSFYGVEEFPKAENISKGGLCFITDRVYEVGEVLLVTCPYEKAGHNIEVRGEIVHRRQMKGTGRNIYGIRYAT